MILSSGNDFNIYGEERIATESEEERLTYIGSLNQSVMQTVKDDLKKENPKQTLSTLEYDDAGNTLDITSGFGYNGEKLDETGNIYLRARYYNPRIGQFVQIDSNRGNQQEVATQNRYTYVANNQYKYIDSNGNIFGFIKKAVNTVVNTAKKVVKAVVDVGKKIVNTVVDVGKKIVDSIVHKTNTSEVIKKNVPNVTGKIDNGTGKNGKTTSNKASNSKVKAPEPESCPFKDFLEKHGSGILDAIQFIIDFAGMLLPPGASTVLDIANALIYLVRNKPIDFIVSVASVVIVAVGGYVFKTLKATGKFDKVIEGIVKIKSNAKQLITNGLTRANNFIQGITIPFTGWIKDAFGGIISKAKGFVVDVFQKYGPKPSNSSDLPYKLDIQMFANVSITKGRLTHIYNDHTVNRLIPQLSHLSREGLEKALRKNSYFPPNWSEEIVRQAVEEAYKGALKHNVKDYTITYLGEKVTVRLNGDNLKTAFGAYKYTVEEFLKLFGG